MNTITPGPWRIVDKSMYCGLTEIQNSDLLDPLCVAWSSRPNDAHAITALPDLIAALQALIVVIDDTLPLSPDAERVDVGYYSAKLHSLFQLADQARAALRSAGLAD